MTASTDSSVDDVLRRIVQLLSARGIAHMIVGSYASTYYGQPRSTQDLDVVIDPSAGQLDALLGDFDPDSYYVDADVARDALRRRTMFNVIDMATGWKIDLVIRKARAFSVEELRRRQVVSLFGVDVATATAEDTIIAKLEWAKLGGSERQLEDVAAIVRVRGDSLDREYIERWVDELELADQWQLARERV